MTVEKQRIAGPRTGADDDMAIGSGWCSVMTAWLVAPLACLALVAGATMTARGLCGLQWPGCVPFTAGGFANVWFVLGGGAAAAAVLATVTGWRPHAAMGLIAACVAIVAGAAWPFLVVLGCCASWYVVGAVVVRALRDEAVEGWWPRLLAGAAVMGTIVGLFAHFPVNGPAFYGGLLLGPLAWVAARGSACLSALRGPLERLAAAPQAGTGLELGMAALGLLHFTAALLPEVGHDGLAYQMFVPAHVASRGAWGFDAATYAWAVMPMLGNWLFTVGYVLAGEPGARLVNCLFVLLLARLVSECVAWAGGSPRARAWAAILHLSSPLTFTTSSSLFIEAVWASFLVGGVVLMLRWASAAGAGGLATCGLLCGGALATKAITLATLPPIALVVMLAWPRAVARLASATLVRAVLLSLIVGGVPYATAWWQTGNPLFPFYNAVFHSPLFMATNTIDRRWHEGLSWGLPYSLTFESGRYIEGRPGAAGFQWLAVLPAAAVAITGGRQRRELVLLTAGLAAFAAVFVLCSYLRYVFPAACLLNAALVLGLVALPRGMRPTSACLLTAVAFLNCLFLNAGPNYYDDFPLRALLSPRHRAAYLDDRVPMRRAVAVANDVNVCGAPVAVLGEPLAAGLTADALYANWYNVVFRDALGRASNAEALAAVLADRGVDFVIVQDTWDSPQRRALVDSVTEPVFSHGGVSVRRIRESHRFATELLQGAQLTTGWEGWTCPPCIGRTAAGEMVVTEPCHGHQTVAAGAGGRYRAAVTARATAASVEGRVQVVWLDDRQQPLRTDIEVFQCTVDPQEHVMTVTAPVGTVAARVFACGHTTAPVIVGAVSLRR